jgi:hypothetical protein
VGGVTSPETIGLGAGAPTTVACVRIVRTRSADAISWRMFGLVGFGAALGLGCGGATGGAP